MVGKPLQMVDRTYQCSGNKRDSCKTEKADCIYAYDERDGKTAKIQTLKQDSTQFHVTWQSSISCHLREQ